MSAVPPTPFQTKRTRDEEQTRRRAVAHADTATATAEARMTSAGKPCRRHDASPGSAPEVADALLLLLVRVRCSTRLDCSPARLAVLCCRWEREEDARGLTIMLVSTTGLVRPRQQPSDNAYSKHIATP